jgi:hypothetical protein
MREQFRAVFEKRAAEINVFCVHRRSGSRIFLGTLDPTEDDAIYEGEYVFNLAAWHLVRHDADLLHIPVNVLKGKCVHFVAADRVGLG